MTHLVVSGLNYHSAPIAIRERLTIPQSCVSHALRALGSLPHVKEAAILSTCNRTEVYAVVSNVQAGWREIESFYTSAQKIDAEHGKLKPNFKLLRDDVALHLFRVAAGLDSMVLGEGQIMSQVKAAHQSALDAHTAGTFLDHLFQQALTCGKRVRTETTMGKRAVSVSSAAVELAKERLGDLSKLNATIIGAGKMAQICVKHLLSDNGPRVKLLNRSLERVQNFLKNDLPNGDRIAADVSFEDRHKCAAESDLVIVSTSAPGFLLELEKMQQARSNQANELCIIDISVPRNVEPAIAELPGVQLFHADDLQSIVNKNLSEREALVAAAENIVFDSLEEFQAWQRSLLVVPTITGLREKIELIRQEQMAKSRSCPDGITAGGSGSRQMEEISRAIVNQILHHPTVQLKATRDYEILRQQAEALRTLFSLDPLGPPSTRSIRNRHRPARLEV